MKMVYSDWTSMSSTCRLLLERAIAPDVVGFKVILAFIALVAITIQRAKTRKARRTDGLLRKAFKISPLMLVDILLLASEHITKCKP